MILVVTSAHASSVGFLFFPILRDAKKLTGQDISEHWEEKRLSSNLVTKHVGGNILPRFTYNMLPYKNITVQT